MSERLTRYLNDFELALNNLGDAVLNAKSKLEIDGSIKRLELCYEIAWKLMKEVLANLGIICNSPRICFKEAFKNDLIVDEDGWLNMIEDRNLLVHTYNFENSRLVFEHIKESYLSLFKDFYDKVVENE